MGSQRSSHSNAYFYGFGHNKCIVLYDTLFTLDSDILKQLGQEDQAGEASTASDGNDAAAGASKDDSISSTNSSKKDTEHKRLGCSDDEILAILSHGAGWMPRLNPVSGRE